MKEVFRGELDCSEAVQTHYYPLTGFFMGTASRSAENALVQKEPNDILRDVIISLNFSAMALEAWANEIAEYVFTGKELDDFISLKGKKYKPTEKCSKILSKHIFLMKEKNHPPIPDQVKLSLEQLIKTRNSLVHYKLSKSAGKSRTRRLSMTDANDPVKWGDVFLRKPEIIEPSLLDTLSPELAVGHYNTVYDFMNSWFVLEGINNGMGSLRRLQT